MHPAQALPLILGAVAGLVLLFLLACLWLDRSSPPPVSREGEPPPLPACPLRCIGCQGYTEALRLAEQGAKLLQSRVPGARREAARIDRARRKLLARHHWIPGRPEPDADPHPAALAGLSSWVQCLHCSTWLPELPPGESLDQEAATELERVSFPARPTVIQIPAALR